MKIFIALLALIALSSAVEFEREDQVLVLTEDTFPEALKVNDKLLVEFYAPWCGHCKKLAPEYAAAAEELAKDGIDIAKVDATENGELAKKYGVSGYPTLKWFVGGEPSDYNGGRTKDEIVNWIRKKSGPPSTEVDATTLEAKVAETKVLVAFIGDTSSDEFKAFEKAASLDDKRAYFHTSADAAAKNYDVTAPTLILFRQFDTPKVVYDGAWEAAKIGEFIAEHSIPTLIEFGDDYIEPIF